MFGDSSDMKALLKLYQERESSIGELKNYRREYSEKGGKDENKF